jgi:DNA transformation protein
MPEPGFDGDAMLARFPGPVTLRANRTKWLGIADTAMWVAIGVFWPEISGHLDGWSYFGRQMFNALGIAGLMLSPRAIEAAFRRLTLDYNGFETRTFWPMRDRVFWFHANGFRAGSKSLFGETVRHKDSAPKCRSPMGRLDRNDIFRRETYGMTAESLAHLMASRRDDAGAANGRRRPMELRLQRHASWSNDASGIRHGGRKMVASDSFAEFPREQLTPLGHITMLRMFGKTGVFYDGLMFGMVTDNMLYFRMDDHNREAFQEAGSFPPLNYQKRGETIDLSFWRAPERLFDEPEELVAWARIALAAARRVAAKRSRSSPGRKSKL